MPAVVETPKIKTPVDYAKIAPPYPVPAGHSHWEYVGPGKEEGMRRVEEGVSVFFANDGTHTASNGWSSYFDEAGYYCGSTPSCHYYVAVPFELDEQRANLVSLLSAKASVKQESPMPANKPIYINLGGPVPPSGLPDLPPVPAGFSGWEYMGKGWGNDGKPAGVPYGASREWHSGKFDDSWMFGVPVGLGKPDGIPSGIGSNHYIRAAKYPDQSTMKKKQVTPKNLPLKDPLKMDNRELAYAFAEEIAKVDVASMPEWRVNLYATSLEIAAEHLPEDFMLKKWVVDENGEKVIKWQARVNGGKDDMAKVMSTTGDTPAQAACRIMLLHARSPKKADIAGAQIAPPSQYIAKKADPFGFEEANITSNAAAFKKMVANHIAAEKNKGNFEKAQALASILAVSHK